jgi:hypothetical protein
MDRDRLDARYAVVLLDPEFAAGEYFHVHRIGPGRDLLPGRVLHVLPRRALVRMTETEAEAARQDGYRLTRLPVEPAPLCLPAAWDYAPPPPDSLIRSLVASVSLESLARSARRLQDFGTRYTYSRKCDTAAWWLQTRFQELGLSTELDTYLCGSRRDTSYNVIAWLPGTVRPESIVIACGHFDSYSETQPNTTAPGADDNATGTAALLELARLLSQHRFRWTIGLIGFSGEEQWMVGSYHWVDSVARPRNLRIAGAFNLDMFAYTAYDSNLIYVIRNIASTPLAVLAESVNVRYDIGLRLVNYHDEDCAGDNTPFWERGFRAVFVLEDSEWGIWNGSNPHYHTPHDTMGFLRLGQLWRGTQLALGCVATLAGPDDQSAQAETPPVARPVSRHVRPNPFRGFTAVPDLPRQRFRVLDVTGRPVAECLGSCVGQGLAPGVYFLESPTPGPQARITKLP